MSGRMAKCLGCGSYTLQDSCPKCGESAASPHPPKFSPQDRYGKYRRQLKKLAQEE